MLKRLLCAALCAVLLLGVLPARAAGVTDVMRVYNCSEWVSLREAPDTNSKRLAKVYLGDLVTDCHVAPNDFIQCEYKGKVGYILYKYLKMTDHTSGESFPGNQMVVNCTEWVSMWESPSTSSKRVTTVPLGAIVTDCVSYLSGEFILCEYNGKRGYISSSYLKSANYGAKSKDSSVVEKGESKYPPVSSTMTVVNCNEWVSLREKASSSAARLAKVPLGTEVTGCVQVSDTFIYCSYKGLWGYIQKEYLSAPQSGIPTYPGAASGVTFASVPSLPTYEAFMAAGQNLVLAETYLGYTIVVRRAVNEREEMMAVCYDLNYTPLWELRGTSLNPASDVQQTLAFVGGVTAKPLLIWYIHGMGFWAYEFGPQLKQSWLLTASDALGITNSILPTVDHDGTIYAAFDDKLLSISNEGLLRWKTSCDDPSICFPTAFEISENYVDVIYDNHPETANLLTMVRFSKDGFMLMKSLKIVSTPL